MIYVGIDPGFSGAWGAVDHNGTYRGCGDLHHDSNVIHIDLVRDDLLHAVRGDDFEVVIESVHAMPGQGVSSTFKFGKAFGQVIALAQMMNCPWHFVTPQKWKGDLGLTSDKEDSLNLARHLYPDAPLTRKKDNGRAEALLIAGWWLEQMS